MKNLLANFPRKPLAFISLGSLLMTGKISVANETVKKVQPVKRSDASIKPVSGESQRACVRHSKFGTFFCANANQLSHLKKGNPQIDAADLNNEKALLSVTDAESDAAVDMFGCDCVASINCLRKLRNSLP